MTASFSWHRGKNDNDDVNERILRNVPLHSAHSLINTDKKLSSFERVTETGYNNNQVLIHNFV